MNSSAIKVHGLSKQYSIGTRHIPHNTLRDALMAPIERFWSSIRYPETVNDPKDNDKLWALRDLSFEVPRGEVLGIIGRNGAGKSTLLKILSRITEPTFGEIGVRGRVGSLLEVGTGFHSELTGRENIYLNGAILGMTRAEITRKFEEIVAFAEVERFLDTPVKHYSSGMYLRLGFAVAAHLEPEILIIDEVLAVGDAEFQKRCIGKMDEVARDGRTVIFVSHNLNAVQRLCGRCLHLEQGRIVRDGAAAVVVAEYLAHTLPSAIPGLDIDLSTAARIGSREVQFVRVCYSGTDSKPHGAVRSGGPLHVEAWLESRVPLAVESFAICVRAIDGRLLVNADTITLGEIVRLGRGSSTLTFHVEALNLMPGRYILSLWAGDMHSATYDYIEDAFEFEVSAESTTRFGRSTPTDEIVPCKFWIAREDDPPRVPSGT